MRNLSCARSNQRIPDFVILICLALTLAGSSAVADTRRTAENTQPLTVFGPKTFVIGQGGPPTFSGFFKAGDDLPLNFVLEVTNGSAEPGGNPKPVSGAIIRINDVEVLGLDDLNQQIPFVEKSITLPPENKLVVELNGALGDGISVRINATLVPRAPILDPHPDATSDPEIVLTGTADFAEAVEILTPTDLFLVDVIDDAFSAPVELEENRVNQISFTAITRNDERSPPTSTSIVQDSEAPSLFIDFPADGAAVTTVTTDVAGRVSDMLSGFMGLTVFVNGIEAIVDVGIGTNGTFFAEDVPLLPGAETTIEAIATDALGNHGASQITVTQVEIPPDAPRMETISGNGQTQQVDTLLPEALTVRVTDAFGTPFADKLVTFKVTRSNGRLSADGSGEEAMMLQARTDAFGEARAAWRLGSDAGCGNNRVEVFSRDIAGTVFFCATATAAPAAQLNIGSGNNQRAEVGGPLPEPLTVWVSDGRNPASGVPVTFTVESGGGQVDGTIQTTVLSGLTGHASVELVLGSGEGNQTVVADFADNPGAPTTFVAFGLARNAGEPTRFEGLVIDNANRPIEGVELTLSVNGQPLPTTLSDLEGQFAFVDIPAGPARLHVDGLVATGLDGLPIPPGSFPQLDFDLTVVPEAANALPSPILLPPLNPDNAVVFDNTDDVVLTVAEIEGLSMLVKAGSMTRANGTVPSPEDPAILSLNQVHFDDVPMPMPDGVAPPFAWTLQPAGARFDPPIKVTYPNMSGLPAGSIAYFLSFNHETAEFEIVATGSVDSEGLNIVSDPGAGISISGWGCNCPPYAVTGECCACGPCEECVDGACVAQAGMACCDGVEYDPAIQGCCEDSIYDLATEGCCEMPFGDEVYVRENLCCENGFLVQKHPIKFVDWLNPLTCDNRVPTVNSSQANPGPGGTWRFEYDGCTNPIRVTRACTEESSNPGALCLFEMHCEGGENPGAHCSTDRDCPLGQCVDSCPGGDCDFTMLDKDNPGGGADTRFSGWEPGGSIPDHNPPTPFLACDGHDECYQTCNSDRAVCDNNMLTGMLNACNQSGDPEWIVERCLFYADAYFIVLRAAGRVAGWGPRQREVCDCCTN